MDAAHALGLLVLMDICVSHFSRNALEGIGDMDGSESLYQKGSHPDWDCWLYDTSKPQVVRYLASMVCYWLEEFKLDGFRFDAVTSMFYKNHGNNQCFRTLSDYYTSNLDSVVPSNEVQGGCNLLPAQVRQRELPELHPDRRGLVGLPSARRASAGHGYRLHACTGHGFA